MSSFVAMQLQITGLVEFVRDVDTIAEVNVPPEQPNINDG